MKAFTTLANGIDALELTDRPQPTAADGEVLVKIKAVSLNYRDLLVIGGKGRWKPNEPRVPLSDGAGEIAAIGANVTRWRAGDRVAGVFLPHWQNGELTEAGIAQPLGGATTDGVLSEYRVFAENAVVKIPDNLSFAEAATLPCAALTAWHAVKHRSRVKNGETVVVQGTGGVSLFALAFSAALGARVIVTSSSDEKLEQARELGASGLINYRRASAWDAEVLKITNGGGAHHIFEMVGGANLNLSLNALKMSGSISLIGLLGGGVGEIDTSRFFARNAAVHGVEVGSREMFEEMNRFIETHDLKPVIDREFAFTESREALQRLESAAHFGKIVIDLD